MHSESIAIQVALPTVLDSPFGGYQLIRRGTVRSECYSHADGATSCRSLSAPKGQGLCQRLSRSERRSEGDVKLPALLATLRFWEVGRSETGTNS
jgi:hypothetical protein